MGKWSKRFLGAGIIAGAAYAVWRVLDERARESAFQWTPQPFPSPPMPVPHDVPTATVAEPAAEPGSPSALASIDSVIESSPEAPWVEPDGDGCPTSHPVKAKLASGIYHAPGGQMYDRTVPDRCYRDAAAAEADGLRASKR